MIYDVCIIGAGPAGLACLSAIQEPYSLDNMTEGQIHRAVRHYHLPSCRGRTVAVVDPAPEERCWMEGWKRNFRTLDIRHLRSPAMAHPDMFDQNALLASAERHGRQDELIESGCGDLRSLLPLNQTQVGLWKLPSLKLFCDFCDDMTQQLEHDYRQGMVTGVTQETHDDGEYDSDDDDDDIDPTKPTFLVSMSDGTTIKAKAVILALGSIGKPIVPPLLRPAPNLIPWTRLDTVDTTVSKKILVIGGGLTAVQVAQRLLKTSDDTEVTICSRRPLVERHFDIPLEWFDRRTTNKCMADFYHWPHEERLQLCRAERDGGSVPGLYMRDVRRLEEGGRLCRITGAAEYTSGGQAHQPGTMMAVKINGSIEHYDAIVLACGAQPDIESNPLCRQLLKQWPVPTFGGFPCVSEDAEWIKNLYVVGGLSSLSIGPDAANLMGMRRAAQIVANALECRCWLRLENVLKNPFSLLYNDDSTDSESENDDDDE